MISIEDLHILLNESFKTEYDYLYPLTLDKHLHLIKNKDGNIFVAKCVSMDLIDEKKVQILLKLDHPRISPVIDHTVFQKDYLLIKPYIKGKTLYELVEETEIPFEKAILITMQIIEGLKYLYQREDMIVFRDLQPKNIIVDERFNVTLIDTETIREYKIEKGSDTVVLGTLGFIAPEQYGFYQTTDKADMYSLGIILYYILKGKIPKYNNNFLNIEDVENLDMKKLIYTMTQFDPDRRYNNINEVEAILHEILQPSKRDKKKIGYYIIATVLVIGITLSFTQQGFKDRLEFLLTTSNKESTKIVEGGSDKNTFDEFSNSIVVNDTNNLNQVSEEANHINSNQYLEKTELDINERAEEEFLSLEKNIEEENQVVTQKESQVVTQEEIQEETKKVTQPVTTNSTEIIEVTNENSSLEGITKDIIAVEDVTISPNFDINRVINYEYFNNTVIEPTVITNLKEVDVLWKKINYVLTETSRANVSDFTCVYGEDEENYYIKLNYNLIRQRNLYLFFAGDYPGIQTKIGNLLVDGNNQFIIQINKEQFNSYVYLHRDEMERSIVIRISGFDDDTIFLPIDTLFSSVDKEIAMDTAIEAVAVKEIEYSHSSLNIVFPILVSSASVQWQPLSYLNSLKADSLPVKISYGYDENSVYIKTVFTANESNGIAFFLGGNYPGLMTKIENCVVEGDNTLILKMNKDSFLEVLTLKETDQVVFRLNDVSRAFYYIYFEEFDIN